MLSRKLTGSASFVCLRCRLQLAGAPKCLPFPAVALSSFRTRTPPRYFGTYAGLSGADGPPNGQTQTDGDTNTDPTPEPGTEPSRDTAAHNEGAAAYWPPPAPPPPQHRTYKSRGHIVSPEQEGLSIGILGKPGSAIVLRERRALSKNRRHPRLTADQESAKAHVDPASLLPDEAAGAASEDILLNIHELKPVDTQVLTDKEFRELRQTLLGGFTNTQLAHYIREYKTIQRHTQADEHVPEELPWVLERQPWAPTVANAASDIEPHLDGYITKTMAPKMRLAVRLMRECWDVSNEKVLDLDGYLSIRLRDVEFSLLTLGNQRWLEGTPRDILANVKQVKLIRESRVVSVVAPKHTADSILDRANGVLSNARTSDFAADLVSPKAIEPSVLEEVGRMTNTVTRLDPSGKKVVVTWIHMPDRDENFENAGETVLRFLRDAYGAKSRVSAALDVAPTDLAHQGRYLPVLNYTEKLPWQERSDNWERWTTAIPRWNSDAEAQPALIPATILPFDLTTEATVKEVVKEPETSIDSPPDWSLELQTDTSAVFGNVVFARQKQPASAPIPLSEPTPQLDTSLRRTFVPTLPALGSLNLPNNLHEEGLWHTTIVIRFTPTPDITSPELASSAPDLELRVDADHKEIKSLTSLRALNDTFTGDVLFPTAAVDARLVQQRYFHLPGASIEHHVPPVLAFLSKCDLRPWDNKLNTPPVLPGVRLPRRLLLSLPNNNNNNETATDDNNNNTPSQIQVDYTFASVEVQRTVTAEYENLKLRYTSIKAGQRGGERSELSLEAVHVEPQTDGESSSSPFSSGGGGEEEKDPFHRLSSDRHDHHRPSSDRYEIVDEADIRSQLFSGHTLNDPVKKAAAEAARGRPTRPVELGDFIRVASDIVNEKGRLKWHAKRS
ncbi:mitochondrial inner-membrane-bound regulator-domain-containing protein [Chaetomidium leptoderma]|uniref:Mitochondrial inner-membrane-bound regulator-domain-containing protein n=1 Tax=Chaetomidium leptoderma TaxID=669021 RepID=A0AAN6ZYT9_9PEZI|nr:mitochondrial inner-membrane-bound regulator-domain-containing protein [Chaetomidium leptoderma]